MTTSFDRWEKDPFFAAAEEVQESADRMESTYRTWIHSKRDRPNAWDYEQLHRDLHTTLGTTKWQLEEFQKAVRSSYDERMSDENRDRHRMFIIAIENQVVKIEKSLKDAAHSEGEGTPRWVRLNKGECDELALFLTGPSESRGSIHSKDCVRVNEQKEVSDKEPMSSKLHGHRRTASATANIGAWDISISDEPAVRAPRKVPSFSGFLNFMESASNLNSSKNCVRKWKAADRQHECDAALLPTQAHKLLAINASSERSKSCMECEDCYDKQLHGWYGALQRQLQRSQYLMQYSRPVQVTIWILLLLFLIALVAIHTI